MFLPCPNRHLLRLTALTALVDCVAFDADSLRAARFAHGKQNREDPILKFRLDIVGIDRPGEGYRPFKRASDDFPREPVVSFPVALCLPLLCLLSSGLLRRLLALLLRRLALRLSWLRLLSPGLLALPLTFGLVLMVVLMAEAASNRQGVLINSQFNIFWSHSWKRNTTS